MPALSPTLPKTFYDFDLIEPLQRALHSEGYHEPTPIQAASIGPLLEGRDLLGCAQTGTGKTAAFAIPILQRLDADRKTPRPKCPQVLVLSPTRELASQISASFESYGKHLKFRVTTVFGGVSQGRQVRALERGVHICVATPGRLLDLFGQGCVWMDDVETFVLDEADRMLDLGFMPDLRKIMKELPPKRHSLFFSATMPPPVKKLAEGLLTNHVEVIVTPPSSTVERIEQCLMMVEHTDKMKLLRHVLDTEATGQVLVFTKTKRGADRLSKQLQKQDLSCEAIHGGKTQAGRERVLQGFRNGKVDILIATDLAARGIDIEGLSHVINYDMPHDPESYVHRIGRTGRAGAEGMSVTFCTPDDHDCLNAVEKLIGQRIPVDSKQPFHTRSRATTTKGGKGKGGKQNRTWKPRPGSAGARSANKGSTMPSKGRSGGGNKKPAGKPTGKPGPPNRRGSSGSR